MPYWFKNDVQDKKNSKTPPSSDKAEVKSNNLSTLTLEASAAKTEHVNVS